MSAPPIAGLLRLDGRCAVVTGGARGIGLAIAGRLAEAGARVAIGDIDSAAAEAAALGLQGAAGLLLDVRDAASVTRFAEAAEAACGRPDIWVNNAGLYPMRTVLEMEDADWDRVLDVNLRGCFLGSRAAARCMTRPGAATGGVILNVTSVAGFRGRAGLAHYSAAKHGVAGLTKSLAIELGPAGIRVLAIAPTLVATPGLAERRVTSDASVTGLEAQISSQLPLGRIAQPDDVARVALFCVSDMASLMTGSTVFVDAGAMAS